jgi:hypothetical protein
LWITRKKPCMVIAKPCILQSGSRSILKPDKVKLTPG